jgi:hypothetical protein
VPTIPYVRSTHSDGQSFSAAKANQLEAGCNDLSYAPAVRVYHNTTQSITSGVETTVAFNSERIDQAGNAADTMHDNTTNNSRLTCRYAGVHLIHAQIVWAAGITNAGYLLRLNGTTYIADVEGSTGRNQVTTVYPLAVNDYVELRVIQTSGGAVNISSIANYSPEFMMVRVA